MDSEQKQILAVLATFVTLAVAFCIFMAVTQSFAARCTRAGYEAAALERCVVRVSEGGPVYEENIGLIPQEQLKDYNIKI